MDIFLAVLFIIVCILLIIVVLLQKGRGGGLGAAFGGAGSSAFGTKTGDVFTWVTIVLTALFLILAVSTVLVFKSGKDQVQPPTFSPAAMPIDKATQVVLIPGEKGAKSHYTTDGSTPTKDSTLFTAPINVMPGATIKAISVRGSKVSPVVTAAYPVPGARAPATRSTATTSATSTRATSAPTTATVPAMAH